MCMNGLTTFRIIFLQKTTHFEAQDFFIFWMVKKPYGTTKACTKDKLNPKQVSFMKLD
jgi:hypothetical protein